jgi:alkaline phosphatase D
MASSSLNDDDDGVNGSKEDNDGIMMVQQHAASPSSVMGRMAAVTQRGAYESLGSTDSPLSTPTTMTWFWVKLFAVISMALLVDVGILLVYIYRGSSASSLYHQSTTNTQQQSIPWLRDGNSPIQWKPLPSTNMTKLAFGSCSSQSMPQPYWDTLVTYQPDVVVLAGDNVYGDCQDANCSALYQAYRDWMHHASFVGATQRLSIVATLDDHDYGVSDCWSSNPYKELAKQLFLDFYDIHDERRTRVNEGVYQNFSWGTTPERIQLLLLDTRYHRSQFQTTTKKSTNGPYVPDWNNTDQQMLSRAQWQWLEEQLQEPANVRLIVSSIQVINEGTGYECWRMLPFELERLYKLLNQTTGTVLLLSGDRHVGGLYQYQDWLWEMTASAWTHTIPLGAYNNCTDASTCDEVDPSRVGDLVRDNHFGSVQVDWTKRTVTMALRRAAMSDNYLYHDNHGIDSTDAGDILLERTFFIR